MIRDLALVVVAGGAGSRFGSGNKLLLEIAGAPVFIHALRRLGGEASERILVVPREEREIFARLIEKFLPELPVTVVSGGGVRTESVKNGLAALSSHIRYAAIHDAARPLADADLLRRCYARACEVGGAIPGHPVVDTVKLVGESDDLVAGTPPRARLRAVATPQVFELARLREAYRRAEAQSFTDDAAAMEHAGFPVAVVPENSDNRKLTYRDDVEPIARRLAGTPVRRPESGA